MIPSDDLRRAMTSDDVRDDDDDDADVRDDDDDVDDEDNYDDGDDITMMIIMSLMIQKILYLDFHSMELTLVLFLKML